MKKKILFWIKTVVGDFNSSHCSMHAAGLTYFSMLALVPLLCVLLSVAKICGADDFARNKINEQIDIMISNVEHAQEDDLAQVVAPVSEEERERKRIAAEEFAAQAREISNGLFERIAKFDVWTFGWIGFGFLVWTVISAIGMVETSFNEVFRVQKARPVWKRAYLNVFTAVILPIFVMLALSVPILNVAKQIIVATMGATWLTKWVIGTIVLDYNVFKEGMDMVHYRTSMEQGASHWGAISKNLAMVPWMMVCLTLIVFVVCAAIRFKKPSWSNILMYLLVALAPYLWYLALTNHSFVHFWFTYRLQFITFCALLLAICSCRRQTNFR
jgi:uncharacterized BrkB/YihY/UPF0761 family membrane protein